MHGSVGQYYTVSCVWCRWCCFVVGAPLGLAAAGGQVAFRAPGGLPGAPVVSVGAVLLLFLSLMSGCGLMLLIRLQSGLLGAVCVALFPPLQCALGVSCRCWLLGALFCVLLFLRCWFALVGRLSVLECAFEGFLLLFVLLHIFPLLRLVVTQFMHLSIPP